jgi:hypothetical protein
VKETHQLQKLVVNLEVEWALNQLGQLRQGRLLRSLWCRVAAYRCVRRVLCLYFASPAAGGVVCVRSARRRHVGLEVLVLVVVIADITVVVAGITVVVAGVIVGSTEVVEVAGEPTLPQGTA